MDNFFRQYGIIVGIVVLAVVLIGFQDLSRVGSKAEQSRQDIYRIKVDGGEAAFFRFEDAEDFGETATQNKRWLDSACEAPEVLEGVVARIGEQNREELERLCLLSRRAGIH